MGLIQAQQYLPPQAPISPKVESITSSTTIRAKIQEIAKKYAVSAYEIDKVVQCESGYNPLAVGDKGKSFGLVQIHLPAHPNITKEQAFDEDFALNFIASEFSKNNKWKWSCYKSLFQT